MTVTSCKEQLQKETHKNKKIIKFLNEKSIVELKEMHIVDRSIVIMEMSKIIYKNLLRIQNENKLEIVKKFVGSFDSKYDQRTRAGFLGCWNFQGDFLPWDTYEKELIATKRRIDSTLEKTVVLKGRTMVNFLQRDFQLLW